VLTAKVLDREGRAGGQGFSLKSSPLAGEGARRAGEGPLTGARN
jgi:hypothetical protein